MLLRAAGLPDHIAADKDQQHKGDPVVHAGDEGLKLGAQQPAQEGHQGLKAAEPQSCGEHVDRAHSAHRQTLADGDSEGVHGQPHGQDEQFQKTHNKNLRFGGIWSGTAAGMGVNGEIFQKQANKKRPIRPLADESRHFRLNQRPKAPVCWLRRAHRADYSLMFVHSNIFRPGLSRKKQADFLPCPG